MWGRAEFCGCCREQYYKIRPQRWCWCCSLSGCPVQCHGSTCWYYDVNVCRAMTELMYNWQQEVRVHSDVHTCVCVSEVGCPPGRLYRECERGEDCPFNCAQVSGREACYSEGCQEGCHCPPHTYQHHGLCVQVSSSSRRSVLLCSGGRNIQIF